MPADSEKVLEEARQNAKDLLGAHMDGCQDADPDYVAAYAPIARAIDRLVQVARLVGQVQQVEADIWIAHSDAGCERGEPLTGIEQGRIAAFEDLRKERDRLLAELEKVSD